MTEVLLGIDLGQTQIKALVVDLGGRPRAVSARPTGLDHPHPGWAERDLGQMWDATASTIREALGVAGDDVHVVGIGVSGHSDGLYLVDDDGQQVRPAIVAIDSRARAEALGFASGPRSDRLLHLSGQLPMAASPGALIRWLRTYEPDSWGRATWILSSTDWLRLMLTGVVVTDPSMAAAGFTPLSGTASHAAEVLDLYDARDLASRVPHVVASHSVIGQVTRAASGVTGLATGTPVVAGGHDACTGALGLGATEPGAASIILGTYSINQVLETEPHCDERWQVRPSVSSAPWLHMSTSPAGAGCLDWVLRRIGPRDSAGRPDAAAAVREAELVTPSLQDPYFLPFVHGAPFGMDLGAGWLGLRSEHERPALLRAVLEGVAFSHRLHVDALRTGLSLPTSIRVGGGGARSSTWTQLLADTLDLTVEVTATTEVSALGGALLAGVGTGVFATPEAAAEVVQVARRQHPAADRAGLDDRFAAFTDAVRSLHPS